MVPELQQLVVTDGKANVYVYDLRLPQKPDAYQIPGITGGTDALDYNPLNHTVYIVNGNRNYITGIDLLGKSVTTRASMPGSTELMRWNPNDGLVYQAITDGDKGTGGVAIYDPVLNSVTGFYPTTNCTPHGIEIDAPTNYALLGCGTTQAQILVNLKDGNVVKTFHDVTSADLPAYSPNTRHFYTGTGGNKSTTTGCPSNTDKTTFPIVGIISPLDGGKLIGVICSGRGTKTIGVDTIQNLMFVGGTRYPAEPGDSTTGVSGVQVFFDSAPGQPLTRTTSATTTPVAGKGVSGTMLTRPKGRNIAVDMTLQGVSGLAAIVSITTTYGNEPVECSIDYPSGAGAVPPPGQ